MKIVIPGGNGQIGALAARHYSARGDEVVVLSRRGAEGGSFAWRTIHWDGENVGPWAAEFDGADVVLNLAGRSVDCRYTPANRRAILESRTKSTRVVGEAIRAAARPPKVWLQSSTATIYAHSLDRGQDETTGTLGGGEPGVPDTWNFSIEVAKAWEREAQAADTPHTRKVLLRSAMTMTPDRGGVFDTLLRLVRWGVGGTVAGGRQYVSWIHGDDFLAALDLLVARDDLAGAANLASPNPLPYREFMKGLRAAWGTKIGLPATAWMLEVAAYFLRTESELVLKSRRVVPGRLLAAGFSFKHPDWPTAARDLVSQWKQAKSRSKV